MPHGAWPSWRQWETLGATCCALHQAERERACARGGVHVSRRAAARRSLQRATSPLRTGAGMHLHAHLLQAKLPYRVSICSSSSSSSDSDRRQISANKGKLPFPPHPTRQPSASSNSHTSLSSEHKRRSLCRRAADSSVVPSTPRNGASILR